MREPFASAFPRLREEVRKILAVGPECHGWDHTVRVWHNARRLARAEKADEAVVEYAAILHDIGRADEFAAEGQTCHAEVGAGRVPGILRSLGIEDEEFIRHVSGCVSTHRFRKREESVPKSLEARVVFDADKLDSMGAIGVGRAFHFAGRVGARVHNTSQEALNAPSYSREDSAHREFLVKLRRLHKAMLTDSGRMTAAERHEFMTEFFDRLGRETEGEDYGA